MSRTIHDELRLVASVGVAPNKFLAKIASDVEKPDGFVVVETNKVRTFLDPLSIGRIWGVGKVTGHVFDRLGIRTIGQLRELSIKTLTGTFGAAGEHYWRLSHGIDDRRVVPDREAKSISHETTFPADIADVEVLRACLIELVQQVARRLRRHGLRGRVVELKVRFADFTTITRSMTIDEPTDITQELLAAGVELLTTKLPAGHLPVRLLAFSVHDLGGAGDVQGQLFGEQDRDKERQLDQVADAITAKFGTAAIRRGARLESPDR